LHIVDNDKSQKVKVKQTRYIRNADLGDPYHTQKIVPGPHNVAILTTSFSGRTFDSDALPGVQFDEDVRHQVYLQLSGSPALDTIDIINNSLVHLLGRYDWPLEDRIFLPLDGSCIVDSINGDKMFFTLKAAYKNSSGAPLEYDGQFKIKTSD